jgi:hypothetical protein
VFHLDRGLAIAVAEANVLALEDNVQTKRVQDRHMEALRHAKQVVAC